MSRRLRTTLELALVTLFAMPLLTPLMRWALSICTHDGHLHYHRVVAMLHAWRNGLFFSRWLPDLAFGYGYPFFLYREPLPLYLSLWPHLLGMPLPAAVNLFYAACIVAAGWFTYLWVRDIFGARAGLVAAVAYMAAPYQLIDALVRGNQVESLALALFPLILWAGRRFVLSGQTRWFLTATLGLATLAVSHNISLLLFTPALVLYLFFCGWAGDLGKRTLLWRAGVVVGLGLTLTSFYTAPAVLEIDEVSLVLSTNNRNNDFRFNFATPGEIFAPVTPEDPGLINPPLPLRLGWMPTALALLGLLSFWRLQGREQKGHVLFMGAGAIIYLFFALAASRPLWEAAPLIEFVQFPWRFVGRAALPVAVLAGAPFAAGGIVPTLNRLPRVIGSLVPVMIAVIVLIVESLPLLYPAYCVEDPYPTIHNVHTYEQASGMVGVDPVGSYFPVTVAQRPQTSPLLADYEAGRTPQRFDVSSLPSQAELLHVAYDRLGATIEVDSPQPFQARYLTFAFPGWRATVDGDRVPITPEDPSGLITFPVPEGQHTLRVEWGLTPLRAVFGALSVLAALGVMGAAFYQRRRGEDQHLPVAQPAEQAIAPRGLAVLALLALLLLGGKLLLVDRVPNPLRRAAPPPVTHQTDIAAGGLQLAGFNLSREAIPSGQSFDIDLAWQVQDTPGLVLQSNVWVRDAQGIIWSERETYRPRMYEDAPPTQQWLAGQWAWDSREVHLLSGTPPGRYELVLTLFNLDDLQPLTLVQPGNAAGPEAVIGEIDVLPPEAQPQFQPSESVSATINGLQLLGYNQDRDQARPGDPLLLTLFWERAGGGAEPPAELTLRLLNATGAEMRSWQIPPAHPAYEPARWQRGERVRGQHLLRLPATLDSGVYNLWLEDVALGALSIEAPVRLLEDPVFGHGVDQTLGDAANLVGYDVTPVDTLAALQDDPPAVLDVRLVWRALAEMDISYVVFVHLVDEDGAIIAQSDAEPAQWQRPTTGWSPGEYIVDEHSISLPAQLPDANVALRVGLFDPGSGERLLLPDGSDAVLLQP